MFECTHKMIVDDDIVYQIFQITLSKEFKNSMEPIVFTIMSILYMFIANYVGQNITDHNNHIYVTA